MVCIHICASPEWEAVKEILEVNSEGIREYPLGEYFKTRFAGATCFFYKGGSTKTRSAAACQYAIDHWSPSLIVNIGTCGGVGEGIMPLDIILANKTAQYDVMDRMGAKRILFYESFVVEIDNSWIRKELFKTRVIEGFIATADQDVDFAVAGMLKPYGVLGADWESGAISVVCHINNIRYCILRGVTDIPREGNDREQGHDYEKNTPEVMRRMVEGVMGGISNSLDSVSEIKH